MSALQYRYLILSKRVNALAKQARELFEVAAELANDDPADRECETECKLSDIYVELDYIAEDLAQKGGVQ